MGTRKWNTINKSDILMNCVDAVFIILVSRKIGNIYIVLNRKCLILLRTAAALFLLELFQEIHERSNLFVPERRKISNSEGG